MALLAVLMLAAINADEPPPRWWLGLGVSGGARVERLGARATLSGGIELGVAPLPSFRLRASAGGTFESATAAGLNGSWRLLGGADLLFQQWWGDVFAGLGGGVLTDFGYVAPLGGLRAGIDITLALPLTVGFSVGYSLAGGDRIGLLHFVELGGRLGLAF